MGDSDATLADLDEAVFLFTFPPIQSAFKVHGSGEGARAQIDIPENQMGAFIKLLQWRGGVMEARVRLALDKQMGTNGEPELETRCKRKSEWTS